jgi:hypothetical protein
MGWRSRGSAVGIATSCILEGQCVAVGDPHRQDRLWRRSKLVLSRCQGYFTFGETAGVWGWQFASNWRVGQEYLDLYIQCYISTAYFVWTHWVCGHRPSSGILNCCRNQRPRLALCKGSNSVSLPHINSVAFSPQANYTDWATDIGLQILVLTFADRGVSHGQRGRTPTIVNLSFVDRSHYFFFQVVPHLSSRGWVDPVPNTMLLAPGIESGTAEFAIRNSDH